MTVETSFTADAGGEALTEKRPPSQMGASMEQRYAENVQLQIKLLIAQLQNTQGGSSELATAIGELGKRADEIGSAIASGSAVDMIRLSDAALMFYAQHYTAIMQEAEKIKDKEGKEAVEKTAELLTHAAEVAQTQHFMERNIDGFDGLSQPAKQYFAEDVQAMLDKEPVLKKAMQMSEDIEKDPVLKEELDHCRRRAKEAWEDLLKQAQENHDKQMEEDLCRMRELMGKDKYLPAQLIAIHEKLKKGEISYEEAQAAIHETVETTEKAVKGILLKSYEHLSDEQKGVIAQHLGKKVGEKVTAEDLMKFMKEMEEKGLLKPERINEAMERMQKGEATEEDRLVIAGASLKFKTEVGKGLYNVANHLTEMKEREPEKYKEFMERMEQKYTSKDMEGVIGLMEEYGVAKADGFSYEQKQFMAATMKNLDFKGVQKVVSLVQDGIATGRDVSDEIRGVYFEAMGDRAKAMGYDLAKLKDDPNERNALQMAFLQQVYAPSERVNPHEDDGFSLESIISGARNWIIGDNTNEMVATTEDIQSPGITPRNDAINAIVAANKGSGIANS